ncbi:MAG TPA: DNA polymerase III subunit delta [Caldithrix abyssi]|uniref:DNA polymerase III subunit delta n=1 Tax=Caldithrix abyssi TaxID=187145 RepID=A0A7V4WUV8_CALAY|nr:DNA polymerase III subunit delta [Caldithrix abyssi]
MAASYNQVIKDIRAGKIAPVYFLVGPEKYFHDRIIEQLVSAVFPDQGSKDLNLTILYGTENDAGQLLTAALDYPMLGDRKLVIAREFQRMPVSDEESFLKYFKNPPASTCLVLSAAEDKKNKLFRTIRESALTVECKPVYESQIGGWIQSLCKEQGYSIEGAAVHLLADHLGTNLLAIEQELAKIFNYKIDDRSILAEDVEQITGISRQFNVFALQEALSKKDLKRSLLIGSHLMRSGQSITMLISILFAFYRKLLLAAFYRQKGFTPAQIREQMHISEFQYRGIAAGLSKTNFGQIKSVIGYLQDADIQAKTSSVAETSLLQMLCFKICRL